MYSITLQTSDNVITSGDRLGFLNFASPNESDAGASILIAGSVYAQAEGSFSSSSNPTSIVFATAASDASAASGKIRISEDGHILPMSDDTYDIGNSALRFRNQYIGSLYVDDAYFNAIQLSGTLTSSPDATTPSSPRIVFESSGNVTPDVSLYSLSDATGSSSGLQTLSIQGSAGELFSIKDLLNSGVIFSVNDISGLELISADASGTVRLVKYGENVAIGNVEPTQKLHVSDNIRVEGAYYDSSNGPGTSGQLLSSVPSGTLWIDNPSGVLQSQITQNADDIVTVSGLVSANTYTGGSGIVVDGANQINVFGGTGNFSELSIDNQLSVSGEAFLFSGAYIPEFEPVSTTNTIYNVSGDLYFNGSPYIPLPTGGLEGQILYKPVETENDLAWIDNYATEFRELVKNDTGSTINKGTAVMATGAVGDRIQVAPAVADGSVEPRYMFGVTSEDIADSTEGYVSLVGPIKGVNTSGYPVGTILWIDPDNPGGLTDTQPTSPDLEMSVAIVTNSSSNNGRLFVRMWEQQPGIHELHDVNTTVGLASGDILYYDSSDSVWKNVENPSGALQSQIDTNASDIVTVSGEAFDHTLAYAVPMDSASFYPVMLRGTTVSIPSGSDQTLYIADSSNDLRYDNSLSRLVTKNLYLYNTSTTTLDIQGSQSWIKATSSSSLVEFSIRRNQNQKNVLEFNNHPDGSESTWSIGNLSGSSDLVIYSESGSKRAMSFTGIDADVGVNTSSPDGKFHVLSDSSSKIPLISQGASSQSANLQEWQNSAGTTLAYVDSDGNASFGDIFADNLTVSGTFTYVNSSNVTIADKQLELASQSGSAIGNDATVNDGGIVLKSTNSDKQWIWKDATDSWYSSENISLANSKAIIFGDATSQTTAYTGQEQAVSGWAAAYADAGDAAVSGWASAYADAGDTAVSGWASAYADAGDTAVSGWAGGHADAGDAAVSGWASAYADAGDTAVSGWASAYADAGDAAVSGWAAAYADAGDVAVSGWAESTFGGLVNYGAGSGITIDGANDINVYGGSGHFVQLDVEGPFTAQVKSFLIDHPSRSGMKLQYASLEGPENGVYVRGTTSLDWIDLPDYWSKLVDETSITVNLTPVDEFQPLYVKEKSLDKIKVGGVNGRYDYTVYAERIDVPFLEVERWA